MYYLRVGENGMVCYLSRPFFTGVSPSGILHNSFKIFNHEMKEPSSKNASKKLLWDFLFWKKKRKK